MEYTTTAEEHLQLTIEVTGKQHIKCLRLILDSIELLLSGWYQVSYQVLIPCNCQRCTPHPEVRKYFTLQEIEVSLAKEEHAVRCTPNFESETDMWGFPPELREPIEVRLETLCPDVIMS